MAIPTTRGSRALITKDLRAAGTSPPFPLIEVFPIRSPLSKAGSRQKRDLKHEVHAPGIPPSHRDVEMDCWGNTGDKFKQFNRMPNICNLFHVA
jgi:hypothetical protein